VKSLIITSKDNPRVKHIIKLLESRDCRYEHKQYVLEGIRALDGLKTVEELFVREGASAPSIVTKALYTLSPKVFDVVAKTEHSQGVMAVCAMPPEISKIDLNKRYILLDRLQDPGNMGAIMRTACAFGFDGVLITKGSVDPFSPKAVRSAMGAEHITPIKQLQNLDELAPCNIIAADMHGTSLPSFNWPSGFVLCIGSEAHGISQEIETMSQCSVAIPIQKNMESLNASVSAGILAYAASSFCHEI
jgi:TrmH family RNA methyltransferase